MRATATQATANRPRWSAASGLDRVAIALFSLTVFLLVLALLGSQLRHSHSIPAPRAAIVRRVYRTTVIERVLPAAAGGFTKGTTVSQSVSGPGAEPALPAIPVTRTS